MVIGSGGRVSPRAAVLSASSFSRIAVKSCGSVATRAPILKRVAIDAGDSMV